MILSTFRPAFFPSLEYFWQVSQCQVMIFADHLPFSKGSGVNRSAPLNTAQDVLTIPVQHEPAYGKVCQKKLVNENQWKHKHLKTLHHLFHHFPFAEYYLPELEAIYFNQTTGLLGDFLFELHKRILKWLHLPVQIYRSCNLEHEAKASHLVTGWCKQFNCSVYRASLQTFEQNWIDAQVLTAQHIKAVLFNPFPDSTFLNNFKQKSIIHFILQFGPEAGYILKQYASKQVVPYPVTND